MFWPIKAAKKQSRRKSRRSRGQRTVLHVESLETRDLLAGVVDIQVAPYPAGLPANPAVIPGDLYLRGDAEGNHVVITANGGGSYTITRPANDNTTFTLNGVSVATSQTVNLITGDVVSELLGGTDSLTIRDTTLPSDLVINNTAGDDVYTVDGTLVSQSVWVASTGGRTQLKIQKSEAGNRSTVTGLTALVETGGGGSEVTVVDSDLNGTFGAPAGLPGAPVPPTVPAAVAATLVGLPIPLVGFGLTVLNGGGQNTVKVLGDSTVGGGANPPNAGQNAIAIVNGPGGSNVYFGPDTAGSGKRVSVFGGIRVANGSNSPGQVDLVNFSQTDVTGGVGIDHLAGAGGPAGNAMTIIANSKIGTDITPPGVLGTPVGGYPLEIIAEDGQDSVTITSSTIPWGAFINNDAAAGGVGPGPSLTFGGSTVSIASSSIGTRPGGPGSPVRFAGRFPVSGGFGTAGLAAGDALFVSGDQGPDAVTVNTLSSIGNVNINVFNGVNSVTVMGANATIPLTTLAGLNIITGIGNDVVTLNNIASPAGTYIELGFGSDTLQLIGNVQFAANPGVGALVIFTGTPATPGAGANDTLDLSKISTLIPSILFGIDVGFDTIIT